MLGPHPGGFVFYGGLDATAFSRRKTNSFTLNQLLTYFNCVRRSRSSRKELYLV